MYFTSATTIALLATSSAVLAAPGIFARAQSVNSTTMNCDTAPTATNVPRSSDFVSSTSLPSASPSDSSPVHTLLTASISLSALSSSATSTSGSSPFGSLPSSSSRPGSSRPDSSLPGSSPSDSSLPTSSPSASLPLGSSLGPSPTASSPFTPPAPASSPVGSSSSASSSESSPSTSSSSSTEPTSGAPSTGYSLTQKLLLADSVADRFSLLPDDAQFVFDFSQSQYGGGSGGELVVANRKAFPALVGTGSGMAVGRVGPCGMNTFHVHPRSAELQLVIQGRLVTEMTPENGVLDIHGNRRIIRNEIGPFQMTPLYQGSIHAQFNPDCTNATFVSIFASEDFGTGQVLDEILSFTDDVIAASFGQSIAGENLEAARKAIPTSIALGIEQCLQQCGIEKKPVQNNRRF